MNDNEKLLDKAIDLYLTGLKGLDSFISEPSAEYSLSFEQYLILKKIVHNPKIKLMDIADERGVTRSAISRQLRPLLNHNYIQQEADPEDRRRLFLISTIRGKQVEQHIGSLVLKRFSNWLDVYGKDRGAELLDLLEDFNKEIVQANYSEEKK
ncbi:MULTISPECIES: MarR family winged helix-turn-helix transcriptional regulator [Limosilactobacillus]|jgi:DNA-binding MarR family transcriptional regulator|uniref:Transcriptional regulator, MarR family n=2 Tax=Limosilactobacillus vaginalis TaxID=1633 RepID=C2ETI6_9LACO|nr:MULTISPECIES: MarR family transcriptional regulator [Limosilactobacillus]PEH03723.1 MarR family transcriptional regulator [Lactobacillus sp. UMNPBX5]EEJ40783.1 transcriptional regulator, MarR family [Limosilactobacillus vaginalis DSM 5837 = ATCC 49540]KRM48113.1 MarR family transcriptional regulator [Limosilactobacillus vaginalis DSM 5837 = ATCC 49540]MCI6852326.1 MarR family transcriptional regulator [Limosilactobacillus vaginalis]MCZ3668210.1 MarR family transcriptional regulator [Limosil